jgi:hypothetical protein
MDLYSMYTFENTSDRSQENMRSPVDTRTKSNVKESLVDLYYKISSDLSPASASDSLESL